MWQPQLITMAGRARTRPRRDLAKRRTGGSKEAFGDFLPGSVLIKIAGLLQVAPGGGVTD